MAFPHMAGDIGVIGLGAMGLNLARNIATTGVPVTGYDVDSARRAALREHAARDGLVRAVETLDQVFSALAPPRRLLIMTPAAAVDSVIGELRARLAPGDIVIDGGNSHFADTDRRCREMEGIGVAFLGLGISGGTSGALHGPAIMAGGTRAAWDLVAPIFRAIAARAEDGEPCVDYLGPGGAGHYVKMVHNGLEYGDMQLIAEAYDVLRRGAGLSLDALADTFDGWNRGELRSYLLEIATTILRRCDDGGQRLIDVILDEAEQKGTGRWMSLDAWEIGVPIPTVTAAVEARMVSTLKAQRQRASRILAGPSATLAGDRTELIDAARQSLYASRITLYAQGFALLAAASERYGYGIDGGTIARIWRSGCIIRSALLDVVREAFRRDRGLVNLLLDESVSALAGCRHEAWRRFVQSAVGLGIPVPAAAASLAYYDAYRSERLPASLTQAQRDLFGAHGYRRIDADGVFHAAWTHGANAPKAR